MDACDPLKSEPLYYIPVRLITNYAKSRSNCFNYICVNLFIVLWL